MTTDAQALEEKLNHERARLIAELDGITEDMASRRVEGVDGWTTIHDAMRHVASAEQSMIVVAERTVAGTYQPAPDFDLNRFNARQVEKRQAQSWEDTLKELANVRANTLTVLHGWDEEQLNLPTVHPVWGDTTVGGLFRIIAIHDSLHRKDVETLRGALQAGAEA
ncbi:MAG: DinB family protein [Anaerolineae bacterium]